jgi:hypothetical protein
MKITSSINKLITNKYVLYLVLIVSFMNFIGYIMVGNLNASLLFILFGLILFYFSKNMIIVLTLTFILTNLFTSNFYIKEGFEKSTDSKITSDKDPNNLPATKNETDKTHKFDTSQMYDNNHTLNASVASSHDSSSENESGFEVGRSQKGGKIDYASTITDAYSQLNELIGSDGIKNLTNDTQNLMKQQVQLAESMNSMKPLIEGIAPLLSQAQGMLGSLDHSSLNNIASIAKGFSNSVKK